MKLIVGVFLGVLTLYLSIAFAMWDIHPKSWGEARAFFAVFAPVFALIGVLFVDEFGE